MLRHIVVPIHSAGWPLIAAALVVALLLTWAWTPLFWPGLLLVAFVAFFFRDPPRVTPLGDSLVVSPADGHVWAIGEAVPPPELEMGPEERTRVSIFLSVIDVHVNRVPASGRIDKTVYHSGRFLNAALDKASEENERQAIAMTTRDGATLAFVQIAGLVARRIICHLREGQEVRGGERFGLIRFGSRLDVYLPQGVAPLVAPGQRMIGGETVIADLASQEGPRGGEER